MYLESPNWIWAASLHLILFFFCPIFLDLTHLLFICVLQHRLVIRVLVIVCMNSLLWRGISFWINIWSLDGLWKDWVLNTWAPRFSDHRARLNHEQETLTLQVCSKNVHSLIAHHAIDQHRDSWAPGIFRQRHTSLRNPIAQMGTRWGVVPGYARGQEEGRRRVC